MKARRLGCKGVLVLEEINASHAQDGSRNMTSFNGWSIQLTQVVSCVDQSLRPITYCSLPQHEKRRTMSWKGPPAH